MARDTADVCRPVFGIMTRLMTLTVLLGLAIGLSCCWYSLGYTWIFDEATQTYPIFECPSFFVNTARRGYADGPMCRVSLANNGVTQEGVYDSLECVSPPLNSEAYITCFLSVPCRSVCNLSGTNKFCPDASLLSAPTPTDEGPECDISLPDSSTFTVPCFNVNWTPFCESTFRVTPGAILAMRSLIAGACLMIIVWLFAELTLWSADRMMAKDLRGGKSRQELLLPETRRKLRERLEIVWQIQHRQAAPLDDKSVSWGGASEYGDRRTPLESRDPRRRFSSLQWQRRVAQWRKLHGQKSTLYRTTVFMRSISLSIFFVLVLVVAMHCIVSMSPAQIPAHADMLAVLEGTARILPLYTWMDCLIFLDILLDFGLFIVAVASVCWPTGPVFATHMKDKMENWVDRSGGDAPVAARSDNDTESSRSDSLESVLDQALTADCCLLIACHESCLTTEKESSFRNTLTSALRVFPPNHIFVCDNGSSLHPVDTTEIVARSIHSGINYLYIPEGNKTIAFYWTNRYWIPFLEKCDRIPHFKYALIIDDDVPLPPDLHIPHQRLLENPRIKAVHYPITAAVSEGEGGFLIQCQDIEYKLAAVHKNFQSTVARVLSCHGAIALWEREALTAVLLDHDTVFNGEDMYMGISLLRRRDDSRIISCPQSIVPTFAPTSWRMLFRQRVKSWEVTSHKKTFTFLLEIINPISFFHLSSLALKPYFLQEFLAIILDWLRMFLLISLAFRDYMALALMTAIFTLLMYMQVLVFQFVYLRRRRDLRVTFAGIAAFPYYRLTSLLFRVCALCQNILVYSHYRKGVFIRTREDEVKDLPACPPHPDVDWFTVWEPSSNLP